MANRSYIYIIKKDEKTIGLSEAKYDIPLVFKILVSQHTQMVKSRIFEYDDTIALQGDFKGGIEKLYSFLDNIYLKQIGNTEFIQNKIKKTKEFFESLEGDYFYLDASEVLEMDGEDIFFENKKLFERIKNIDKEIDDFYKYVEEKQRLIYEIQNKLPYKGLFAKGKNEKAALELKRLNSEIDDLFFMDYWGGPLYYTID